MPDMKPRLLQTIRQAGIYQRLKSSPIYDWYWRLADERILIRREQEVQFYRDTLKGFRNGDLIFDIGANHGQKTDVFLRLGAKVVAVDPDELNQATLRHKFLRYRLVKKPVVIVGKAVSDREATSTLWIDEPGSAKNTLNSKWVETLRTDDRRFGHALSFSAQKTIETVTLDRLISLYQRPFFIKIDVEGHEVNVLRGLSSPVPYLSFEVNLPEFQAEGLECIRLLGELAREGTFNYAADCERGLGLKDWLRADSFMKVFERCAEESVEIFWRNLRLNP